MTTFTGAVTLNNLLKLGSFLYMLNEWNPLSDVSFMLPQICASSLVSWFQLLALLPTPLWPIVAAMEVHCSYFPSKENSPIYPKERSQLMLLALQFLKLRPHSSQAAPSQWLSMAGWTLAMSGVGWDIVRLAFDLRLPLPFHKWQACVMVWRLSLPGPASPHLIHQRHLPFNKPHAFSIPLQQLLPRGPHWHTDQLTVGEHGSANWSWEAMCLECLSPSATPVFQWNATPQGVESGLQGSCYKGPQEATSRYEAVDTPQNKL